MLGRLKSSHKGETLPTDWQESLSRLLNETYQKTCEKDKCYFDVFGQIFSEELLLIVSYLSEENEAAAPVTLFLSCEQDQIKSEKIVKETQNNYLELTGLFFDEIFGAKEWNEFEPNWQEVEHNKQKYFYKISRENINLTIEANKLLGEEFSEEE
jgi:hypothetical protein